MRVPPCQIKKRDPQASQCHCPEKRPAGSPAGDAENCYAAQTQHHPQGKRRRQQQNGVVSITEQVRGIGPRRAIDGPTTQDPPRQKPRAIHPRENKKRERHGTEVNGCHPSSVKGTRRSGIVERMSHMFWSSGITQHRFNGRHSADRCSFYHNAR